jgi:hypothetical protein
MHKSITFCLVVSLYPYGTARAVLFARRTISRFGYRCTGSPGKLKDNLPKIHVSRGEFYTIEQELEAGYKQIKAAKPGHLYLFFFSGICRIQIR